MDNIRCEQCGKDMEYRRNDTTQGWYCIACDWSIITSNIDPVYEDEQIYEIFINCNFEIDIGKLRTVSKIMNVNFIEAKHILNEKGSLVYKGKAVKIKQIRDKLNESVINYYIKPNFPF